MQDECEEMLEDIVWNEEADCFGYWKDGVFYEQPQYCKDNLDYDPSIEEVR
jgi:hypothetical protein